MTNTILDKLKPGKDSTLFPDVKSVIYNKYSKAQKEGFTKISEIFFDNIIVWCINRDDLMNYHTHIRQILREIGLSKFNVSLLNSGRCTENDIIPVGTKYKSFKVSLSREDPQNVCSTLRIGTSTLNNEDIYIHDIDITLDCRGAVTRQIIEKYIIQNNIAGESDIVNDANRVGNNCISWYSFLGSGEKTRVKIYNKFAQMLESAEVRTYIGSRISSIIADPCERFRETLKNSKDFGLTRLEIKIYASNIHNMEEYSMIMNDLLNIMRNCKVYEASFENQWKALVDEVFDKHVLMVYIQESKIFAYCHWWNSLTQRRQGIIKKNIEYSEVSELITNYSFNERVTKYIEITSEGTIEKFIKRTIDNITLVPGPSNSLYPSTRDININPLPSFEDMGLINYKGMNIGWPPRIGGTYKPLSRMQSINEPCELIHEIINPNKNLYKASHIILNKNSIYKVIGLGKDFYRGNHVIFMDIRDNNDDETHVRAGKTLYNLLDPKLNTITNHFYIKTGDTIRSNLRNIIDINVTIL